MKATCSCMILVRDDRARMIQSIQSALASGCFEEIVIIVDSRAKREIRELLSRYRENYAQIRLYGYRWSDPADFADARNHALEVMTMEYGFWLDSDEILVEPQGIRRILEDPRGCAHNVIVASLLPDGRRFSMYQPRLFPRVSGVLFECAVFERLDWSLERAGVCVINTPLVPIYHTGYLSDSLNAPKMGRNIAAAREWLSRNVVPGSQMDHIQEQYRRMTGG